MRRLYGSADSSFSEIKIDRSFTQNILASGTKRIITETIVSLGQELGARIIAEGIEAEQHQSKLMEIGCLIGQGYLLSRPLPAEQFSALLEQYPIRRTRLIGRFAFLIKILERDAGQRGRRHHQDPTACKDGQNTAPARRQPTEPVEPVASEAGVS
jgi:hypothetical protein